jgi:hypothetical protein
MGRVHFFALMQRKNAPKNPEKMAISDIAKSYSDRPAA